MNPKRDLFSLMRASLKSAAQPSLTAKQPLKERQIPQSKHIFPMAPSLQTLGKPAKH